MVLLEATKTYGKSSDQMVKGITQMSLLNPFSTNASNSVHITNKYYKFSGLNVNAIHFKWNDNVTNENKANILFSKIW